MPFSNTGGKGRLGIAGSFLLFGMIALTILLLVNSYNQRYRRALRDYKDHPVEAVESLVSESRGDDKLSIKALDALCQLDGEPAITGLIELLDLPDGKWNGSGSREILWKALSKKLKRFKDTPGYSPTANEQVRLTQKQHWLDWLARNRSSI